MVMVTLEGHLYTLGTGEQGQLGRVAEVFSNRGGRQGLGKYSRRLWANQPAALWLVSEESWLSDFLLISDRLLIPQIVIVKGKVQFIDAFCGSYVTFAVSKDGHVYGFGLSNYHQLGQYIEYLSVIKDHNNSQS